MSKLQIYELEQESVLPYFIDRLKNVNTLCDFFLKKMDLSSGEFFTVLPKNVNLANVTSFEYGGYTRSLRYEISQFINKKLQKSTTFSCVFDDYNSEMKDVQNNDLYGSFGMHFMNEVYYYIRSEKSSVDLINKCLQYSNAVWHSFFLFTTYVISSKNLNEKILNEIVLNSAFSGVDAFDGESYIFWQKKNEYFLTKP
jgi:hypothetical protein